MITPGIEAVGRRETRSGSPPPPENMHYIRPGLEGKLMRGHTLISTKIWCVVAFYDRGSTFPLFIFLNDGAP